MARSPTPIPPAPEDVAGWYETRWGMTDEEIVATVGAANLGRYDQRCNRFGLPLSPPYSDFVELTRPGLQIGQTPFRALFLMRPDDGGIPRLVEVILRTAIESWEKLRAADVVLIRNVISERFGKPTRDGTTDRMVWRFPSTTIVMEYALPDVAEIWFMPSAQFQEAVRSF